MRTKVTEWNAGARTAMLVACAAVILAPLPAAAAGAGPESVSDPFEKVNRAFFGFHQMVDHYLIRPVAVAYTRILPKPIRSGLSHVISNLGEPAVFVNDLLQGHPAEATQTFTRFAGNTTFGILGIFDVATHAGLPHHPNDFGITLARYGFKPGPYIFIPLAGPTTVRDAIGSAAGMALNPLIFLRYRADDAVGAGGVVGGGLESRAEVDDQLKALFASATDPYASFRSYYLQNRQAEVNGGRIDVEALPDFDTPDAVPAAAPLAGATAAASPPVVQATPVAAAALSTAGQAVTDASQPGKPTPTTSATPATPAETANIVASTAPAQP